MGFESVYFTGGRARHRADHLTVDDEPELVVLSGHGDLFAGVDHTDVDPLGGDHDGAALGHAPPDDDRPGGGCWRAGCTACSAEPVPVSWRDGAGQGAQECRRG